MNLKLESNNVKPITTKQKMFHTKTIFPQSSDILTFLRSINFREADTLVALKVYRKDADGSLIIFWKTIKNFEKPLLARN